MQPHHDTNVNKNNSNGFANTANYTTSRFDYTTDFEDDQMQSTMGSIGKLSGLGFGDTNGSSWGVLTDTVAVAAAATTTTTAANADSSRPSSSRAASGLPNRSQLQHIAGDGPKSNRPSNFEKGDGDDDKDKDDNDDDEEEDGGGGKDLGNNEGDGIDDQNQQTNQSRKPSAVGKQTSHTSEALAMPALSTSCAGHFDNCSKLLKHVLASASHGRSS